MPALNSHFFAAFSIAQNPRHVARPGVYAYHSTHSQGVYGSILARLVAHNHTPRRILAVRQDKLDAARGLLAVPFL